MLVKAEETQGPQVGYARNLEAFYEVNISVNPLGGKSCRTLFTFCKAFGFQALV